MKIAILGCGWLGLPLGNALRQQGHSIYGSVTSPEKAAALSEKGILPFVIQITVKGIDGSFSDFIQGADILIIALPPRLKAAENENFVRKINVILQALDHHPPARILFISSTSVYADSNTVVTEHTLTAPDKESGKQLLACEALIRKFSSQATILRFAGLIAEDRQPVLQLSGKTEIPNGEAPVNLIHRDDCIGIISEIIRQQQWGKVFNAAHPNHPSRKVYYTERATALRIPPPNFSDDVETQGKIISSTYLINTLQYQFLKDI
ncbi:SDR family oxidoreductase [Sinomicrobium sp.]